MTNAYKISLSLFFTLLIASYAHAAKPSAGMGKGLYHVKEQKGAVNSCLHCHGLDGAGGKVKEATNLTEPKKWKIYKILGGDAAFAKDKAGFLAKMKKATVHLILKGAVVHNNTFKNDNPWYDVSKAGGTYNVQMMGVTAPPSKKWIKKYESKGVTKEIASEAVYMYIQSFDKQGVFK